MTKQTTKTEKARGLDKPDVPFSWPPIVAGALDPIRQGEIQ